MVASNTWPSPFTLCLRSLHTSLALPQILLFLKHPWFGYIPSFLMLWVRSQPWKCMSNMMAFSGLVWSQVSFNPKSAWALHKLPNCWIWLSQSLYWIYMYKPWKCTSYIRAFSGLVELRSRSTPKVHEPFISYQIAESDFPRAFIENICRKGSGMLEWC